MAGSEGRVQVRAIYVGTDEEEQAVRVRVLDGSLGREVGGQFVVMRGARTIGGGSVYAATMAVAPHDGIGWQTYGGGGGGAEWAASAGPVVKPGG